MQRIRHFSNSFEKRTRASFVIEDETIVFELTPLILLPRPTFLYPSGQSVTSPLLVLALRHH